MLNTRLSSSNFLPHRNCYCESIPPRFLGQYVGTPFNFLYDFPILNGTILSPRRFTPTPTPRLIYPVDLRVNKRQQCTKRIPHGLRSHPSEESLPNYHTSPSFMKLATINKLTAPAPSAGGGCKTDGPSQCLW
ncbi:hypothetical protein GWI33_007895 [Rhynchophorus ferrugineus]|uniref:Uncharacterized protein n=1 Tax=Rhynchophorus ferrugineus TaxID=354439 RepID=A0A834IDR4_RHYFE|nr:hypothetical protein GWI33_007895 [Rhynchophorus ferrugineus]